MIPASASARLVHDIMMGRSPERKQLQVRSSILTRKLMQKELVTEERFPLKQYKYRIEDGCKTVLFFKTTSVPSFLPTN
jgi:hypothetical protein